MRPIDTLVIHHSAGGYGNVEFIRRMHKAKGWSDIGYHEVIGNGSGAPDGHIGKGRPHSQEGAGVYGNNTGKLHVCLIGQFQESEVGYTGMPTYKQMASLGHWLLKNAERYAINDPKQIVGHKEIAIKGHATACPGNKMPLLLIREWFPRALGETRGVKRGDLIANEAPTLAEFLVNRGVKLKRGPKIAETATRTTE